ncbi:MAG TPA: PKD domain-containing protein [Thermoanaerobaculia bacterium]|nr:PKD domain-containing protein [Thermoanaerobaculia bacterium]
MALKNLSRLTRILLVVGVGAIVASMTLAQAGSGRRTTAALACDPDYPLGSCTLAPSDITLTYRGQSSGCTPTSGSCVAGEWFRFQVGTTSTTYCPQFCDQYRWTFGDGPTQATTFFPYIFYQFTGSGPRTVAVTVTNRFGSASSPTLTIPVPLTPCSPGPTTLCLNGGRFQVQAIFSAPSLGISNAPAQAVALTSDTGYLWFFSSNNVEVVLKVVDGRAFNGFYWVFYGALSDVKYTINVTDTGTGAVKTYSNDAGTLASVADTAAFSSTGTASVQPDAATSSSSSINEKVRTESAQIASLVSARKTLTSTRVSSSPADRVTSGSRNGITTSAVQACTADATTLCLNGGRFQVRTIFSAPTLGITDAPAQAISLTSDTGYFWFFSANNVEVVLKAVDGRAFNGFFWVFYGALSDVKYTITVTDTVTGAVKTYENAASHLASVADTAAFTP